MTASPHQTSCSPGSSNSQTTTPHQPTLHPERPATSSTTGAEYTLNHPSARARHIGGQTDSGSNSPSRLAKPARKPSRSPPTSVTTSQNTNMSAVDCLMPHFSMTGPFSSANLMLEDPILLHDFTGDTPSIESLGLALDDKSVDLISDLPLSLGFAPDVAPMGTVSPQLLSNKGSSQSRKRKASESPLLPEAKRPVVAEPVAQRPQMSPPPAQPVPRNRHISSASPSLGAGLAQTTGNTLFSRSPFPSQSPFPMSQSPFTSGASAFESSYSLDGTFGTSADMAQGLPAPLLSTSAMTLSPNLISTPPVTQSIEFGQPLFGQPIPRPSSYSGPAPSYSFPFSPRQPSTPAPVFLASAFEAQSAEAPRPKPQCWDHGCNGRQFSTFSNLLRHQRERAGTAAKSTCPRCSAKFTRTTAMKGHLASGKCRPRRNSDVQ